MKMDNKALTTVLAALILCASGSVAASAQEEFSESKLVQINLLAASKTGTSDLSDLPANTRKAIEDIKDFLPFKSYKILDTSLVRVSVPERRRGGHSKTFMRGPDGTKLEVSLAISSEEGSSKIHVHRFEVSPSMLDRFRPILTPEQRHQTGEPIAPTPAIAPRADLLAMGALISTSFTAEVGETVVVGSSRLNGGEEALIVLFTALP